MSQRLDSLDKNILKMISDDAFRGCFNLLGLTIPSSVTNIACSWGAWPIMSNAGECSSPFSDCTNLTSVIVPQCVCDIGMAKVFGYARNSITNVVFDASVTNLVRSALITVQQTGD